MGMTIDTVTKWLGIIRANFKVFPEVLIPRAVKVVKLYCADNLVLISAITPFKS